MARTKKTACDDHRRTAKDAGAAEQVAARRRANILRAATIMSSQEIAERDAMEPGAQAAAGTDEDSADAAADASSAPNSVQRSVLPDWVWDILDPPAESAAAYAYPEPKQVIKLSAQADGSGGFKWCGRLRGGGADVHLASTWVRKNIRACVTGTPTCTTCACKRSRLRSTVARLCPGIFAGRCRPLAGASSTSRPATRSGGRRS